MPFSTLWHSREKVSQTAEQDCKSDGCALALFVQPLRFVRTMTVRKFCRKETSRPKRERGTRPLRSGVSVSGGAPLFLSAHFPKRPTCRTERLFIIVTYDLSTISIRTTEDCGYSDSRGDWEKCHCCTSSLYPMIFSISGFFGNQQNCQCS